VLHEVVLICCQWQATANFMSWACDPALQVIILCGTRRHLTQCRYESACRVLQQLLAKHLQFCTCRLVNACDDQEAILGCLYR
jgi:hypothetical protein